MNPHGGYPPTDFKSVASAIPPYPPAPNIPKTLMRGETQSPAMLFLLLMPGMMSVLRSPESGSRAESNGHEHHHVQRLLESALAEGQDDRHDDDSRHCTQHRTKPRQFFSFAKEEEEKHRTEMTGRDEAMTTRAARNAQATSTGQMPRKPGARSCV